jgi:hypothetical protein
MFRPVDAPPDEGATGMIEHQKTGARPIGTIFEAHAGTGE